MHSPRAPRPGAFSWRVAKFGGGRGFESRRARHLTILCDIPAQRSHLLGNPGDTRGVGHGILEMRIDYGPGYRIYYVHREAQIVILLCGGDKRTQPKDIKRAQKLAETL
jgi:putative addiction module killer protein